MGVLILGKTQARTILRTLLTILIFGFCCDVHSNRVHKLRISFFFLFHDAWTNSLCHVLVLKFADHSSLSGIGCTLSCFAHKGNSLRFPHLLFKVFNWNEFVRHGAHWHLLALDAKFFVCQGLIAMSFCWSQSTRWVICCEQRLPSVVCKSSFPFCKNLRSC